MASTSAFGWETPDDTDLVKDGAAAIRTLGNSIDTSMADLKGGTSGQVLSKASNTDMDFTWVTSDDANAIQNAIVDAKGDLIAATAADTPARLAVGTNGQVLTADSTTATGLKWATTSSTPTAQGCYVYKSANQSISNTTSTNITFDLEQFDTNGFHSTTTNTDRITIPTGYAGKYQINANLLYSANSTGDREIYIYKTTGGVPTYYNYRSTKATASTLGMQASLILDLAVGDILTVQVWQDSGTSINLLGGTSTAFSVGYLGA